MTSLRVVQTEEGATLEIRLQPRAPRHGASGLRDGALVLRVKDPPVEGRANEAARRLLAKLLGTPPSSIELKGGSRARRKVFLVRGMDAEQVSRRLKAVVKSP